MADPVSSINVAIVEIGSEEKIGRSAEARDVHTEYSSHGIETADLVRVWQRWIAKRKLCLLS